MGLAGAHRIPPVMESIDFTRCLQVCITINDLQLHHTHAAFRYWRVYGLEAHMSRRTDYGGIDSMSNRPRKPLITNVLHSLCWDLPKCNPYPCGFYGDVKRQCRCSVKQIEKYRQRISGPLLDRIDIHVEVPLVDFKRFRSDLDTGESSEIARQASRQ